MKSFLISISALCYHVHFGVSAQKRDGSPEYPDPGYDPDQDSQYMKEIKDGELSKLLGSNWHQTQPYYYPNFARRFVLQYPYSEKTQNEIDEEAEIRLDQAVKEVLQQLPSNDDDLVPVKAPPEIVLAVAKQAALQELQNPSADPEEYVTANQLRSGDYWNGVYKEEVDDPAGLRAGKGLESIKIKVMPGSKLHKVISITKDQSPQLLYVINKP